MTNDKKISIERIFDAPREKVWRAWTEPELVQKWWGPAHFTAPSIKIDLRVGGKYIYAMRGPQGTPWDKVMYSAGVYKEIVPMEKIVTADYMSDENGNNISPKANGMEGDFPSEMIAHIRFEDVEGGKTKLTVEYPEPENAAHMEAMLKSGMKEGWTSSLEKLAQTLN